MDGTSFYKCPELTFQEPENYVPLIIAAKNGNHKCVDLLIKAGADVNKQDSEKFTALTHAVKLDNWCLY